MSITLAEVEGKVLRLFNKTASNRGPFTAEKCYDAIEESLDAIANEMMIADEGWLTKIAWLDTTANMVSAPVPEYIHMIKELRYLVGDNYVRLGYDDGSGQDQWQSGSGVTQFPFSYRIIDNMFYFNPVLAEGGAKYLMVEYMSYPRMPQDRLDVFEQQFDKAMFHLVKYRSATVLARTVGQKNVSWAPELADWSAKVTNLVSRRNLQTQSIREFDGG